MYIRRQYIHSQVSNMDMQQKHAINFFEYNNSCDTVFSDIFNENKDNIVTLYATIVINIPLSLLGTVANGLIILAYCRNRRLRTIQNLIFFLLAFTDISVTAFLQPMQVVINIRGVLGYTQSCSILRLCVLLSFVCVNLSLTTIVILSLQSFITLAYPYRYQSMITKFRLQITFVFSWLFIFTLALIMVVLNETKIVVYGSLVIMLSAISIVVFTWIWTCRLVARHRRAIRTTQNPSTPENVTKKKIIKSTVTAIVIISSLLACHVFYISLLFYSAVTGRFGKRHLHIPWIVAATLTYSNSLINPCLVFWRNSDFRETACNICSRDSLRDRRLHP